MDLDHIARLIQSGESLADIAAELCVAPATLRRRINRAGIKLQTSEPKQTISMSLTPDVVAFLRASGNMSQETEEIVRRSKEFREWTRARTKRS